MTPDSLNILFAAGGAFALPSLRAIRARGHRILQVISQPDKPAGRGAKLTPTPISQFAIEHSLPLLRTTNLNAESLPPADLLIVIAFGQKISPRIVSHARLGSINLHASLLPKYRGAAPINWAILRGETVTGNSVIRLAEKMDAGAVLAQSALNIGPRETAGELHDRLAESGVELLLGAMSDLANGTAVERPQDESAATLAPKLSRESARLDFSLPADQVARTIRGLSPWPGCRVRIVDATGAELSRITLLRAISVSASAHNANPGNITPAGHIACGGSTAIEVLELQPEGKRPMTPTAFRNGHHWDESLRIESFSAERIGSKPLSN